MNTLKFKTNIKCSGCVATVTPFLDKEEGIQAWDVDTNNPEKILTVQTDALSPEQVIERVKESGFKIESV